MSNMNNAKWVRAISPAAILDNASATATEIDTKGFGHCVIAVQLGATDIAMSALKVQESDTSGSGFGDVTGLIVGTSDNIDGSTSALPAATDDDTLTLFQIALTGARKRYLKVVATAGNGSAGTYVSAMACLTKKDEGPSLVSSAAVGADNVLRV